MNDCSSLHTTARRALAVGMCLATAAQAELSAAELATLATNPVGNPASVPFQNNANYNVGPLNGNQNVLNIQPVIPVSINADWNIITRTNLPVISMPALSTGTERHTGIGDVQFTAFLSPAVPDP